MESPHDKNLAFSQPNSVKNIKISSLSDEIEQKMTKCFACMKPARKNC